MFFNFHSALRAVKIYFLLKSALEASVDLAVLHSEAVGTETGMDPSVEEPDEERVLKLTMDWGKEHILTIL